MNEAVAEAGAPAAAPAPEATPVDTHWSEGVFGEGVELHGRSDLIDYKTPADFISAHNNALQYADGALRIPTAEAGEDTWNQFYERLTDVPGVMRSDKFTPAPDKATEYQFSDPEGFTGNAQHNAAFAEAVHELGLSQDQANGVYQFLANNALQDQQIYDKKIDDLQSALETEWGPAFERNVDRASHGLKMLEPYTPGLTNFLVEHKIDDHPVMVRFFHDIAMRMGEVPAQEPGQPGGIMTPAEAEQKIQEIRSNPNHPRNIPDHPQHEAARDEYDRLYVIARNLGQR